MDDAPAEGVGEPTPAEKLSAAEAALNQLEGPRIALDMAHAKHRRALLLDDPALIEQTAADHALAVSAHAAAGDRHRAIHAASQAVIDARPQESGE